MSPAERWVFRLLRSDRYSVGEGAEVECCRRAGVVDEVSELNPRGVGVDGSGHDDHGCEGSALWGSSAVRQPSASKIVSNAQNEFVKRGPRGLERPRLGRDCSARVSARTSGEGRYAPRRQPRKESGRGRS
jgi:hypothetical protein